MFIVSRSSMSKEGRHHRRDTGRPIELTDFTESSRRHLAILVKTSLDARHADHRRAPVKTLVVVHPE